MMEMSTIAKQHEEQRHLEANGLYSSQFEKDACGMGFVVNIKVTTGWVWFLLISTKHYGMSKSES